MWQSRSVFVSSTFLDMQAERDYLRTHVFPELEELLRDKRQYLEWVDLRAGIVTASEVEEDKRELKVLTTCLAEVKRCRPYLIVILGDRYGWVPPPDRIDAAAAEVGFPEDVAGRSVTELEIALGFLTDPEHSRRTLFYFRESLPYERMPGTLAASFCDGRDPSDVAGIDRARRLAALKKLIKERAAPGQVKEYRGHWDEAARRIAGFDDWTIREDLIALLNEGAADERQAIEDPLDEDRRVLSAFVEEKSRSFIGRRATIEMLTEFACAPESGSGSKIYCLTGTAGSGKSAVFGQLYRELSADSHGVFLLAHSAGASPTASSVDRMLRRWCDEIASALGVASDVSELSHPRALDERFAELLAAVSSRKRVVILIDALDQFSTNPRAQNCAWLPSRFPENVRLIATGIPGAGSAALKLRLGRIEHIDPLTADDAVEIAVEISRRYHRTLDPQVLARLRQKPDEPWRNPLWTVLAAEELNLLTAEDFARAQAFPGPPAEQLRALMLENVDRLALTIGGLYEASFVRADQLFGTNLTRAFLGMLGIGRVGWRETDFRQLLPELTGQDWDQLSFSQLRRHFRGQLRVNQSASAWTCTHNQMRDAIMARVEGDTIEKVHRAAAQRLLQLTDTDPLRVTETMVHLVRGRDFAAAADFYFGDLKEHPIPGPYVREDMSAASAFLAEDLAAEGERAEAMIGNIQSMVQAAASDGRLSLGLFHRITTTLDRELEACGPSDIRIRLYHLAAGIVSKLLARNPSNPLVLHAKVGVEMKLGMLNRERARLSTALEHFDAAERACQNLEASDDSAAVSVGRGMIASERGDILHQLGKHEEAIEALKIAERLLVANYRERTVVQARIGEVYLAQNKLDEAFRLFSDNLEMAEKREMGALNPRGHPDVAAAHKLMGDVLGRQEKFEEAIDHYNSAVLMAQRLIEKEPRRSHYHLVFQETERARGELLDRMGEAFTACMKRASEYGEQRKYSEALRERAAGYAIAVRMKPLVASAYPTAIGPQAEAANARMLMGYEFARMGRALDALRAYEHGIDLAQAVLDSNPEREDVRELAAKAQDNCRLVIDYIGVEQHNFIKEGREYVRLQGSEALHFLNQGRIAEAADQLAKARETAGNLTLLDDGACELAILDVMAADIAAARGDDRAETASLTTARDRALRLLSDDPARADCIHIQDHTIKRLKAMQAEGEPHTQQTERIPIAGTVASLQSPRRQGAQKLILLLALLLIAMGLGALAYWHPEVLPKWQL